MMTYEVFVLYGIPTMFLLVGLIMYAVIRFQSWRYDRLAARNAAKTDQARSGSA
jgi:hypothetical protein